MQGRGDLDAARLWLDAVHDSGEAVELPLDVERTGDGFRVAAKFALDDALPAEGIARLRLRLTWNNSAWETEIAQAPEGVAVSFGPGGVVQLVR